MRPELILICLALYFLSLLVISWITGRKANNETFYVGNHQSPWYVVAYGLLGTTISGVSFLSVTGMVQQSHFSYMQLVIGFLLGYFVIAWVLLPIYYKLNLTSIYNYLEYRFGVGTRGIGSFYFLLSRTLGAAARLFLTTSVLHEVLFSQWNFPFWATVMIVIVLIFIYTFQGGIKTIVWTDTLQTTLLLLAIIAAIFSFKDLLNQGWSEIHLLASNNGLLGWSLPNQGPWKVFENVLAGAFICITMTGLDQGMMQRSLSCRNLKDAQKNILSFSGVLVIVNLAFLSLGALMAVYIQESGITVARTDSAFAQIAISQFGSVAAVLFILGLIAATFSSADDALTALTTSFCVDVLGYDTNDASTQWRRKLIHVGFALLLLFVIVFLFQGTSSAVIDLVFRIAAYTYGPLLGLFAFGILTRRVVNDKFIPHLTLLTPFIMLIISAWVGLNKLLENPDNLMLLLELKQESIFKYAQYLVSNGLGNEVIYYSGALLFVLLFVFSLINTKRTEV